MTTTEQTAAIEQVRSGYATRLAALKAELDAKPTGYVHSWGRYGLGVRVAGSKVETVGVEHATEVEPTDRRRFNNGSGEPAVLTRRKAALEAALRTTADAAAQFEAALQKQEQGK